MVYRDLKIRIIKVSAVSFLDGFDFEGIQFMEYYTYHYHIYHYIMDETYNKHNTKTCRVHLVYMFA